MAGTVEDIMQINQLSEFIASLLPLPKGMEVVVLDDPKAKPLVRARNARPRPLHGRNKIVIDPDLEEWVRGGGVRSVRDAIEAIGTWVRLVRSGEPLGPDRICLVSEGRRVHGRTLLA